MIWLYLKLIKTKKEAIGLFFYTQDVWYFARGGTPVAKIE